jgi:hypothetical protein
MEQEKTRKFIDWRPSDKGDSIGWAFIIIWGALIMIANSTGFAENYPEWDSWGLFFIGIGIIGVVGAIIRLLIRDYPNPSLWDLVFAIFFILLGMGNDTGWIWAIALIVIGFSILRSVYQHHKGE